MEEYIYQILSYLPIKFADAEVNEFIEYFKKASLENFEKEKYQFSFIAFHILYMTFIYKTKWFLKQQGNSDIESILQNFVRQNRGTVFNTLFDLSQFKEKISLEKLLKSLSFHVNDIGICKNHVEVRNNCSHASGRIYYKKQSKVEHYIDEEIEFVEKIHNKIIPEVKKLFNDYLENDWDMPIQLGYIRSWIIENHLSKKDLEILTEFELPLFRKKSDNEKTVYQKLLYLVFLYEARKQIEIDKNIFFDKLPMFMRGLEDEVKVTKEGEEKTIPTQKIIEENLVPIISDLSDEEREKAEKILKLS